MAIRIVLCTQLAIISLVGLVCRLTSLGAGYRDAWWLGLLAMISTGTILAFPVLVFLCLALSLRLVGWRRIALVSIEVGLCFVFFIALLPAVQ